MLYVEGSLSSCCQATAAERTADTTCASDGDFQDGKCELLPGPMSRAIWLMRKHGDSRSTCLLYR